MDTESVLEYGQHLFKHYSTDQEAREQFLFAKALHNNDQLNEDVKNQFFTVLKGVCSDDNHQAQKLAFRKTLLDSIKNMVMWQEFFKKDSDDESQLIFSVMKEAFDEMTHDEFEKQSAYFQLFSEAMYSMTQGILNRYYDEVLEDNYSVMLTKAWRIYFENYFNSILAKARGTEFEGGEALDKLKAVLGQVEADALKGEERTYDLNKF